MSASETATWSGPVGESWVRNASAYDRILEPLGRAALDILQPGPDQRVLDVGCGTGATTLELGELVRPKGSVVGVDISRPMIKYAQSRLAGHADSRNVEFAALDVESDQLPGPFDAAFSRLGVMFFGRPEAAFANIASSLQPRGRFVFVCFTSPAENPFITIPTRAALALLTGPRMPSPGAPGPFSLADPEVIRRLLGSAGFESVELSPGPDEVNLGLASDLDTVARQAVEQNPLVMSLLAADVSAREAVFKAAAAALAEHVHAGEIRLGAGSWIVRSRVAEG